MQEKDIGKLKFTKKPEECEHKNIRGVYDLAAQDGYICLDCGMQVQQRSAFHKK